jgi:Fusaric acid resistance protein-like
VLTVPLARRLRRLPSATAHALRSVVAAPRGRPDPVLGALLAVAVFAPLAVGQGSDRPAEGTIAALGALNVGLVHVGGPGRRRLGAMGAAAVLNAGLLAVGSLVAEPAWLTVIAVAAIVPAVSLAGALAAWAPSLSFVGALMFLIGAGLPEGDAGERFLAALAGGAWAVAVAAALAAAGLRPRSAGVSVVPAGMRLSHALRFGVATAGALALAAGLGLERGYWLGMTIAVVLHPSLDPTLQRTAHRIAGTLGGAVAGAVVIAYIDDPWALTVLVAALLGLAGALLAYHYALGVVALTAGVLALLDLGHPGAFDLVDERIANTLLGAAIAILVVILWPRRDATPAASAPRGA